MTASAYSLLRKAEEITGFTHGELAKIVGVSRPLVQKIIAGLTPEYLTAVQTHALMSAVRLYVATAEQGLSEMELYA